MMIRKAVGASLGLAVAVFASGSFSGSVMAQGYPMPGYPTQGVELANYDLAGSGFVTPAGMPPIGSPGMMSMPGNPIMQVGYQGAGCASGSCDGLPMQACMDRMVCGTCGGGGGCSCNSMFGGGGILGKLRNGGGCLFCRGAGCTACRELPFGYAGSMLACAIDFISPYEEASICNQRWYDLSVEALVLDRNIGGGVPNVITTSGVDGTPVLSLDDVGADDLETGIRVSAAMICGVGGNLELNYLGGNEWSGTGSATSQTPNLYSFISEFGTNPPDDANTIANDAGFDDTDRSLSQSLVARSEFHSAEFNYRQRTMFPYCRFQSSWLLGLRYIRYDDSLLYSTLGDNTNTGNNNGLRFFNSNSSSENSLFGPQGGFDFWWNTFPGLSLGFGAKAAWLQNDIDRQTTITANSLGLGATPGGATLSDGDQDTTVMGEFELTAVYRFSHSFSLRSSYYVMAVEDVVFGGLDAESARSILSTSTIDRPFVYDDLVLQGFTAGLEYMW